MADKTHIEWTDATWQPITGCAVVSPGCTNCYAMRLAGTRLKHHPSRTGLTQETKAGPVWTGEVRFNAAWLDQPLRWRRPRRIFVCAHGDLFAEAVPDQWIDRVFAVMALAPQHTFQVPTKRAERMREYLTDRLVRQRIGTLTICAADDAPGKYDHLRWEGESDKVWPWPLPNIWLGVSVEDQARADERIPLLLDTPAAVRFISAEPLLGPVDLTRLPFAEPDVDRRHKQDALAGDNYLYGKGVDGQPDITIKVDGYRGNTLDWVIAGGESGADARPMHPDWARSLRDQCHAAGVAFFFKQWGHFVPREPRGGFCGYIETNGPSSVAWPDGSIGAGHKARNGGFGWPLDPIGTKAAGRLLDGREWSEFPA